jgi:hypothetical protein
MKGRFALLLLVGALLGLFGQQMAYAAGPSLVPAAPQTRTMADCAMAMPERAAKKSCKGLTLGCIAAMGCVVPLARPQGPTPILRVALAPVAPTVPVVRRLHGIALHPEPDPPTV